MIGGYHLDHPGHLDDRRAGPNGHSSRAISNSVSLARRFRTPALPCDLPVGRESADRDGVEPGIEEEHLGLEAQVVGSDRQHFPAPFVPAPADFTRWP